MLAKKGKKVLAMLLTLCMVLGLLPMSAFAVGGAENQIVSNGAKTVIENGKVTHSKIIEQIDENLFDITLKVATTEEIKTQTVSPNAAVVIVMDVSNSMNDDVNGDETGNAANKRITQAKNAAAKFVDDFVKDAGDASRMVSVVGFGSSAYTVQGWANANGNAEAVKGNIQKDINIGFKYPDCSIQGPHSHEDSYIKWILTYYSCTYPGCDKKGLWPFGDYSHTHKTEHDGPHGESIQDGGGTNIEGGLRLANNLLADKAVSGMQNLYVVMVTDGVPTYYVSDDNTTDSTLFMRGSQGGGNKANKTDYEDVPHVAAGIKDKGAKLYTVSYASSKVSDKVDGRSIDAWLTSFATQNIAANEDIFAGLGQISDIIASQAKAWKISDPMGQYIDLDLTLAENSGIADASAEGFSGAVRAYDPETGILTWDLKSEADVQKETVGSVTTYTYELTYRIKLDTAAEGFVTDKHYATNGTTTLTYMLSDKNGNLQPDLHSTELTVPVVKGEVPEVEYTVNYLYKDKETGKYVQGDTETKTAKLWDNVTIKSADFSRENYSYVSGDAGVHQLSKDGMEFNLKYDPIKATVIVQHYLTTTTNTDEGPETEGPVLVDTDIYPSESGNAQYYLGDTFDNPHRLEYDFDKQASDKDTDVPLTETTTTIKLHYTTTREDRTSVPYTISYHYRTNPWMLNADGKFELTEGKYVERESAGETGKGWYNETVTAPSKDDNGAYELDGEMTPTMVLPLTDKEKNHLDVFYQQNDKAPQDANLTITHKYYERGVSGLTFVGSYNEVENESVYMGETWDATVDTKWGGHDWTCTTDKKDRSILIEAEENTLVIIYERDVRIPASITVNHIYQDFVWVVDPENGDGSYELADTHSDTVTVDGLWVDDTYTAELKNDGYTFNSGDSDEYTDVTVVDGMTINLYYDSYPAHEDTADVTVTHVYHTTHSYLDAQGRPVYEEKTQFSESDETYYAESGTSFTAVPRQPEEDGHIDDLGEYTLADDAKLNITLDKVGGELVLHYFRTVDELKDITVDVTVTPVSVIYERVIDDEGNTVVVEKERVTGESVALEGIYYVGQTNVTANPDSYQPEGFRYDADDSQGTPNAALDVLGEDGNNIILVYSKTVEGRTPASVTVNNHYTYVTYQIVDGERTGVSISETDTAEFVDLYVGMFFDTTDKSKARAGYELLDTAEFPMPTASIKLEGDAATVDFFWYGEKDETEAATVRVVHHYDIVDANPVEEQNQSRSWTLGDTGDALDGFYATQSYVPSPNYADGIFEKRHITGTTPENALDGVTLGAGENVINIYYVKNIDSSTATSVKIIYEYYVKDTFTGGESVRVGSNDETKDGYVGRAFSFTADSSRDWQERSYALTGDAVQTIDSLAALEEDGSTANVLTYKYVFEYSSRRDASVTVEHIYQTYDSYTGSTYTSDRTSETYESDGEDDLYVGSTFTAPVADKAGYACQTDAAGRTITLGYNMNLVRVYYLRTISTDPGNYTVNVVHIDGADGAPNQEMLTAQNTSKSYKVGEEYTHAPAADLPEGYKLAHEPEITGESTANGTVTVQYTYVPKDQLTLKVVYNVVALDGQGGLTVVKTLDSATTSHLEGFEYNLLPAKEFTGYSYLGLAEGSAAAAGTLTADTTVTLNYEANRYQFRVDFINDYNDTLIETVWTSDMTADFGYTLTNADVSLYLQAPDAEDLSAWQTSRMPSGYHLAGVSYPTMGVSGEGAYGEDGETFDASAVTNVVKVHYDYDYVPPVDPVDPDPSTYHVTVKYLEEGTGKELTDEFQTGELRYNSEYDVSAEAAKSISGYTISSVDGETSGRLRRNLTVTVWYTAVGGIDIPDPETPTGDKPELPDGSGEIEITDPETPTGDKPELPDETGETEIVDGGVPLGDLPQTGTVAKAVEPQWTLGLLALLASMAAAGLAVTVSRKKEEEAE